MVRVTGIQFEQNGKVYHYDTCGLEMRAGDYVIAQTDKGNDIGQVVLNTREMEENQLASPLKKIVRIATKDDIQHGSEIRMKEKEAFSVCQKKIAEHKLEMKLVSVEMAFDNSKIVFFFTANGRVDFRSLVKDLASVFKIRIELRQIGVRDEARMLGGLGPCGRPICCGSFLDDFQPVSIKMAKEQNLSLNPTKISGLCGRLMCCLKYEQEHYEQTRKRMPRVGREVSTPDGNGTVSDLNIVKETVFVRITNGDSSEIKEYTLDQVTQSTQRNGRTGVQNPENNDGNKNGSNVSGETREGIQPSGRTAEKKERKNTEANHSLTEDKPDVSMRANDEESKGDRDRNQRKAVRNDRQLGQPVRREKNKKSVPGAPAGVVRPEIAQREDKSESQQKKENTPVANKNNWAEAVEKAMQAMEE